MSIACNNLSVAYGKKKVVDGVSLEFERGKLYLLLGLNGSGKTTFLKALGHLLDYQGEIFVDEKESHLYHQKELAKKISFLQQEHTGNFDFRTEEIVLLGRFSYLDWLGIFSKEDYEQMETAMKVVGVSHLKGRKMSELSGGEKQRVWLAQAIAQDSDFLLLDEPTQNLDVKNKKIFFDLLGHLVRNGRTVICSTHDIGFLPSSDGVLIGLKDGKVAVNEKISPSGITSYFAEIFELNN